MFVESCIRPLAISNRIPRFSWHVPLAGRGRRQSAYRILVATKPTLLSPGSADAWDSGRIESTQSVHVPYGGRELRSNADYYWTVHLWDEAGKLVGARPDEHFGTPLFDSADWAADWIGMGDPNEPFPDPAVYQHGCVPPEVQVFEPDTRAPMMCREFQLDQPVVRARAYVCGLGLYELRLNGDKVGEDVLATPRTDFRRRALYGTYDVTSQLRTGANALGLILGSGWFNGQKRYWGWQYQWYGSPRAIVQLEITLADGSTRRIVSDESWKGAWSPITFNCIYDGETYDARMEQVGWDRPGFDRAGWQGVRKVPAPGGVLCPVESEPNRVTDRVGPVALVHPEPGTTVYDFGRNITGHVRLRVRNAEPGTVIKLRFGEAMHEDGRLNSASNNRALQTDQYICKGGPIEEWAPRFTYHGFQFVELTGYPGTPDLQTLEGYFARDAVEQIGHFSCGSDLINKIHRCTVQSLLCNIQMGVPTDDTQRPERLGWGADAWAYATDAFYNLSMPRLFVKWIGDFRDQQDGHGFVGMITPQAGAEEDLVWSAAFVLIPWWQYQHCGDRRILEQNYPALQRYIDYLQRTGVKEVESMSSDDLIKRIMWRSGWESRFPAEEGRGHLQISQWGDHLATGEGFLTRSNMPLSIATAFYYLDIATMARIAEVLGHQADAKRYRDLATEINRAFHSRFFDEGLAQYDTGIQSAQAWPLAFGMVAEDHREGVQGAFVRNVGQRQRHLTTGYASTRFAIQALADAGRDDTIWMLATATSYPSWGYMLRLNRTTACERWDGEAGSLNHAALCSAIDEWFYSGLAGIRPDASEPGYEKIIFKPYLPSDLAWAQASVRTMRGVVRSAWRQANHQAQLDIEVPANSTGVVHIPCADAGKITESGAPVADAEGVTHSDSDKTSSVFVVGSGSYRFAFPVA